MTRAGCLLLNTTKGVDHIVTWVEATVFCEERFARLVEVSNNHKFSI